MILKIGNMPNKKFSSRWETITTSLAMCIHFYFNIVCQCLYAAMHNKYINLTFITYVNGTVRGYFYKLEQYLKTSTSTFII